MSADVLQDSGLQIAHVLFIDIVGYSKLLTNEQRERLQELNRVVRETEHFRAAEATDKLVRLPTGDGMVLAFFTSPDAPVRCAIAIARALRERQDLPLRMGIHSGPVEVIEDVNDKRNLAGAGVNIAQRVMDCGDRGHILLSARAADDLAQHAEWNAKLHDLGEIEVKHGVRVRVSSLHADDVGNTALPQKVVRAGAARRRRMLVLAATTLGLMGLAGTGFWAYRHQLAVRARAAAEALAQRDKSVAVLPFENLDPEDQNAVFAGSVHREVLSNLAKIAALKVISRTSVIRYKPGAERNVKQIAGELGVAYLVEGTVQRAAAHVRVIVELIDARTERHAWGETYDGNVADVLTFQSEIAERITNQLGAKLSPRESTDLSTRPTEDIAAFESYIRARALMETNEAEASHEQFVEAYQRAVQMLEQTVARDPKFAAAYWALAEANIQLFRGSEMRNIEYRSRCEQAVKAAQEIAPAAGETLHAEARLIYYGRQDFHAALSKLEEAAKVLPNSAEVTVTRGLLYRRFGRWQEAFAQFVRGIELNPNDPQNYFMAGGAAIALRWFDDGDRIRARLVKKFPRFERQARIEYATSLRLRGDIAAGTREMEQLGLDVRSALTPLFFQSLWKYDFAEARRLLDEAAKYPELEADRWRKEAQLVFVAGGSFDRNAAGDAEKRLEEHLRDPSTAFADEGTIAALSGLKLLLGKKEEAIRLSEQSAEKYPVSADALENSGRLRWLAYTYVFAGDNERAINTFGDVVKVPGCFWYGPLKNDPALDGLRSDPRFDAIMNQAQQPFPRF